MSMEATTADNFMKEVRDNFLLCKLCNQDFNKPKTLPCMHTFCHDCLVKFADELASGDSKQTYRYSTYCKPLSCPVCRRRTDVTKDDIDTLPDNFLISSLSGIIRDKSEETVSCQICTRRPKGRKPTAVQRCLECNKQLCKRCVTQHQNTKVTQSHTLYSLENAHRLMCTEHLDEGIRFICKSCAQCVCVFCTHTTHKGHDLISILEGTEDYQQELEHTMDVCTRRMDSLQSQLSFVQTWDQCYNQTRQHVITTAADFLSQVESQKELILTKLDDLYGSDILEMLTKKEDLIQSLERLSSACNYKDVIPSANSYSIESMLIQNELQNKVKHLLDTPLPVPVDQLPSSEVSISFEKGGLSLGSLITQEGDEEPLYYDVDEIERTDTPARWCRKCRSRSRSRSVGVEARDGRLGRSLTPFVSDTDISLTDVSALGTASSLLSGKDYGSLASDVDKVPSNASDIGIQVELSLKLKEYVEASTNYDMLETDDERKSYGIPDVVPLATQTKDTSCQYEYHTTESSTQHTTELSNSFSQSTNPEQVTSSTQHETVVTNSNTQCSISSQDCGSQIIYSPQVNSSTQYETRVCDSSSQSDQTVTVNSSSQYDICNITTKVYFNAACQSDVNLTHSTTQYDLLSSQSIQTMTDLHFAVSSESNKLSMVGHNLCDGATMRLAPLVEVANKDMMTDSEPEKVDQFTTTAVVQKVQKGTSTQNIKLTDSVTNTTAVTVSSRESQTTDVAWHTVMDHRDIETNTNFSINADQASQTVSSKMKSRGVNVRPSIMECGTEVRPSCSNVCTNTLNVNITSHVETQTAPYTQIDRTTNTMPQLTNSRGVTAHIPGTNSQTSTHDLIGVQKSSTQTEIATVSIAVGTDSAISGGDNQYRTTSCGVDTPMNNTREASTSFVKPLNHNIGVNATTSMSDRWTNPIIRPVSSKACGTERIHRRHVGLYVRPICVNSSSMTDTHKVKDKVCGADSATSQTDKQSDTDGLIIYINNGSNTESVAQKELATHFSQTNIISTTDSFTAMLHGLPVDKSTNTPHQIPKEVLDQFQYPSNASAELYNRSTQTEWMRNLAPCLSTSSALTQSDPAVDGGDPQSMLRTNLSLPALVDSSSSLEGSNFAQSKSHPTAPNSNINSPGERKGMSSKSVSVTPIMCDRSTSTATLSTLLHPEKTATDCMDNKISECIVKLRQVTKKLQKSSLDVTKSEHSSSSSHTTDTDYVNDLNSPSSQLTDRSHCLDDLTMSTSNNFENSGFAFTNRRHILRRQSSATSEYSMNSPVSNKSFPEATHDSGRPPTPASSENELVKKPVHEPYQSYWPRIPSMKSLIDSRSKSAAVRPGLTFHNAALRLVKRISRNRAGESEVIHTTNPVSAQSGEVTTLEEQRRLHQRQSSYEYNKGKRYAVEPRTHSPAATAVPPPMSPNTLRQWDLKSLVYEEDRMKKTMRRSTENLSRLPAQSRAMSRHSRDNSMDSSVKSEQMFSAESSLYGSTESLSQYSLGKDTAAGSYHPHNLPSSKSCVAYLAELTLSALPQVSSMTDLSDLTPTLTSESPNHPNITPTRQETKTKARSKQLQPSVLLGEPTHNKQSKEPSVKNASVKGQNKPSSSSTSPRSFVTSVVHKVQTIGKGSKSADHHSSASSKRRQSAEQTALNSSSANFTSTRMLLADQRRQHGNLKSQKGQSADQKSYRRLSEEQSESCGQRLAEHTVVDELSFDKQSENHKRDDKAERTLGRRSKPSGVTGLINHVKRSSKSTAKHSTKKAWL